MSSDVRMQGHTWGLEAQQIEQVDEARMMSESNRARRKEALGLSRLTLQRG